MCTFTTRKVSGNACIVDIEAIVVRFINASSRIISTVMGTSDHDYYNSVDGRGDCKGDTLETTLNVCDYYHIWKDDISSGIVSRIVGGIAPTFVAALNEIATSSLPQLAKCMDFG
jgi:hypothetical protein